MQHREWTTTLNDDEGKNIRNKGIVNEIHKKLLPPHTRTRRIKCN